MKFRKITFHNYRCFLDGEASFSEKGEKNINLLIGPNGGGKTETLFAFWWALYDFDFSSLKGKEDTPYPLNSDLYRELEKASAGAENECSVSLEFEAEGTIYEITKRCEYRKTGKRINAKEYQEFRSYNEVGEISLPDRNPDSISKKLARIIPRNILYGIIFDGERMQKLSTVDENAQKAVRGVISDITNVVLINKCKEYFAGSKNELNSWLKKHAPKDNKQNVSSLIDRITKCEAEIQNHENLTENYKQEKEECEKRVVEISEELQLNRMSKEIEEKRKMEYDKRDESQKRLDNYYKNFASSLADGYLLICEKLFEDTEKIIETYDVPAGLTVPAVMSILNRSECICGRPLNEHAVHELQSLIQILPPDNINSTLSETIKQLKERKEDTRLEISKCYSLVNDEEKALKIIKDNITHYSTELSQLTDGSSDDEAKRVAELEDENQQLQRRIGFIIKEVPRLSKEVVELKDELDDLREKRDAIYTYEKGSENVLKQIHYIDKCLLALDRIEETNKNTALSKINSLISKAYELLSEDYELGRRIRVFQYEGARRYQIAVYLEENYNEILNTWKENGRYEEYISSGLDEDEIKEKAISECIDSNSTGQSKMNTLSFVKAILDYSKLEKNDGIEIKKEYPLLIDAPFGDISGENLARSSSMLHTFSDQIILLLDKERYDLLENNLGKYVSNIYSFEKIDGRNESFIHHLKEG